MRQKILLILFILFIISFANAEINLSGYEEVCSDWILKPIYHNWSSCDIRCEASWEECCTNYLELIAFEYGECIEYKLVRRTGNYTGLNESIGMMWGNTTAYNIDSISTDANSTSGWRWTEEALQNIIDNILFNLTLPFNKYNR